MKIKSIVRLFYDQASDYNLFIPDENDYDDEPQDPATMVKYQKYTTRLYVVLLLVCMYVLFYANMMTFQARTIVVNDIDSNKFEKLYLQHGDTLSCPCSTVAISYQQFVSNTIRLNPVCSSFFVSRKWIEALYVANRTAYGVGDFRKTASSQFQILSSLCELFQEVTLKIEANLNHNQLITVSLLSQSKIESEVNATVQFFRSRSSTRILSFIDYFRIITQSNYFATAHGTNSIIYYTFVGNGESLISMPTYYANIVNNTLINYLYCGSVRIVTPTGISSSVYDNTTVRNYWAYAETRYLKSVKGFFTGCFPFESLLQSTLNCLYEINCLQLLNDNFPSLTQMNLLNLSAYILYSKKTNRTVYNYLSDLFVDEWTTTPNYTAYFQSCNPSRCTYTITNIIDYSSAITIFISLYGGLILILRSISTFLINILFRFKNRLTNTRITLQSCVQWTKQMNLFKLANQRTENDIKEQKLTTHIYLFLLLSMIIVLLLFNSLNTQIVTTSTFNPSLNTYTSLHENYANRLICPCSTSAIPYNKFMSFSPVLHQICSSDLIRDGWISKLQQSTTEFLATDWRNRAYEQFRLLSQLCQLANETITTAVKEFLVQSFVVSNAPTEDDFNLQIQNNLVQFNESTLDYFHHLIDATNLHIQIDQPFMINFAITASKVNTYSIIPIENSLAEVTLSLNSLQIQSINSSNSDKCYCFADVDCHTSSIIFNTDFSKRFIQFTSDRIAYVIPGSVLGCSNINSLLLSTFQCFYSDSVCFGDVRNYLQLIYVWNYASWLASTQTNEQIPKWFNAKPLAYNSTSSTNFDRNTSILTIMKSLMIEQWNPTYSYSDFYQLCSPSYCMYEKRVRANSTIQLIVLFISMIGGLMISMRLVAPYVVVFFRKAISILRGNKEENNNQTPGSWSERLKLLKQKIMKTLYDVCINLNLFPRRIFRNNIDQITAKSYGRIATRLYLILLIVCFVILTLYTVIQQRIMTNEFNEPSFQRYNELLHSYGNQLKCSCSSISSTYSQFIEIKPIFHEICSSSFTSDEMIETLSTSFSSNLLAYEKRDYRRFILSHIQYLRGLCQMSIQSVNTSVEQFLSTLFISKDLLFEHDFHERINVLIEQTKQSAPENINTIFFLIRNINFGNAIISAFGTNFKYVGILDTEMSSFFQAQSEIYDNDCSCALNISCTSQAYFIKMNSSEQIPLEGLKVGCTPTESLLSSTFQCFYNSSCVNIIKEYTNYAYSLRPLLNQSQITNRTISEFVENLFIDDWITTKNYSSYYHKCSPQLCTYTYVQRANLIYLISFLLGFQGGLSIVLKWICPKIVQLTLTIKTKRRINRLNTIHPTDSHIVAASSSNKYLKLILFCLFMMILIGFIILFSIYFTNHSNHSTTHVPSKFSTESTLNANVTAVSTTISSTTKPCNFKFETISITMPGSFANTAPTVIGDFNNDNRQDIAYVTTANFNGVTVILGNEDGETFRQAIISPMALMTPNMYFYTVADFNHDGLLDIVLADNYLPSIRVLIGDGNGTFDEIIFSIESCASYGIYAASIGKLNNDRFLDFAVLCTSAESVNIIFGNANGISAQKTVVNVITGTTSWIGTISWLGSVEIADMNGDSYGDLVVTNNKESSITVFLTNGNGSFNRQKFSLVSKELSMISTMIGDFNNDSKQDVSYIHLLPTIGTGMMFGYNDGTFDIPIKLNLKIYPYFLYTLTTSDLNGDGYFDFVTTTNQPYTVNIYFGDGNGNFELYTIFSSDSGSSYNYVVAIDFNDDDYRDIFVVSDLGVYIFLNTGQCDH